MLQPFPIWQGGGYFAFDAEKAMVLNAEPIVTRWADVNAFVHVSPKSKFWIKDISRSRIDDISSEETA